MKTIYLERYEDEEAQLVYIGIDENSYLEIIYSHGSIAGIWVQSHPLKDRLEYHKSSDLRTGEVPGITDEMIERLIVAAKVAMEFRTVIMPIVVQPERFLRDARLQIAPSI